MGLTVEAIGSDTMPEWPDAKCWKDRDPDRWFPDHQHPEVVDPVRRICWSCPRRDECLDHALENRHDDGVWGGMNESQRRRIRAGDTTAEAEWSRFHGREDHRRRRATAEQLRLDLERKHPEIGAAHLDSATKIVDVIARQFEITPDDIYGRSKAHTVVEARQKAMLLVRMNTRMSYADIGRMFDRDHTTVMAGVSQAARRWSR